MTDKTKPWLTDDHPESILCKAAGKPLYNQLIEAGIQLTGFGVGLSDDKQSAAIYVYLLKKGDVKKIPTKFEGYEVKAIVTGDIVPL